MRFVKFDTRLKIPSDTWREIMGTIPALDIEKAVAHLESGSQDDITTLVADFDTVVADGVKTYTDGKKLFVDVEGLFGGTPTIPPVGAQPAAVAEFASGHQVRIAAVEQKHALAPGTLLGILQWLLANSGQLSGIISTLGGLFGGKAPTA
jgi:hypothetical protein